MSGSSIRFHWSMWFFFHANTMRFFFFFNYSSVVQLEIGNGETFSSSLIVWDCFDYPVCFAFSYEVENCPFKSYKELCWDFDQDCVASVDCFWSDGYVHCANPANPWAWEIFSSSDIFSFFLQSLEVFVIQVFDFFMLFEANVKGVVFLIYI